MAVTHQDVVDRLATCDPQELRLVLEAAAVPTRGAETPRALAERVADALWWSWASPLAWASGQVTLDQMVNGVARRLKVKDQVAGEDAWERLDALTSALAATGGPVAFEALRADHQARARGSVFPSLAFGGGAGSSYVTGAAGRLFLRFAASPIGRVLPWIPQVAPWFHAIRKASAVAAAVGTPLAVALGVLAVNRSLGTRWRRFLPLLLSVGTLGLHTRVAEAVELG
jgi:hypothetical protein